NTDAAGLLASSVSIFEPRPHAPRHRSLSLWKTGEATIWASSNVALNGTSQKTLPVGGSSDGIVSAGPTRRCRPWPAGTAVAGGDDDWGAVGGPVLQGLPADRPGVAVEGHDGAFGLGADAHDEQVALDQRGGTGTVPRDAGLEVRGQVLLPENVSFHRVEAE